jgi:TP901 family phage tail tape measure protein
MSKMVGVIASLGAAFLGVTALVRGFTAAAKTFAGFEFAMARVEALTFASEDAMAAMTAEARRLGATTMFSASEAAEGLGFLSQAGFTAEQSIASLESTLNLAAAGNLGLGEAADIASNIMSGFSIQAEEAGRVADVLALIQARANTNVQGMGEAMKFVAPFASALGISLEETSAAVGVLANNGIKAGLAGRGLSAVMGMMINPNEKAAAALSAVGLSASDINPEVVGLQTSIANLGKFDPQILAKMFGAANFDVVASLIKGVSSGALPELTQQLENSAGTAQKSAAIMSNTLVGAYAELKSAIQELVIGTGEGALGDFFRDMLQNITEGVRQLQSMVRIVKNAFASGDLGELVFTALKLAGLKFVNMLGTGVDAVFSATIRLFGARIINSIANVGAFIQGILITAFAPLIGVFGSLFMTIGNVLGNSLKLAGNYLYEKATSAALTVLEAVNKIPGIDLSGMIETVEKMNEKAKIGMLSASHELEEGFFDQANRRLDEITDPIQQVGKDLMAGGDGTGDAQVLFDTAELEANLSDLIDKNWGDDVADETKEGVEKGTEEAAGMPTPELTAEDLAAMEEAQAAADKKKKDDEDAAKKAKKDAEAAAKKAAADAEAAAKKKAAEEKRSSEEAAKRDERLRGQTAVDSFRQVGGGGAAFNVGAFLGLGSNTGVTSLGAGAGGPLGAARVGGQREVTVLNDIKAILQQIRDRVTPSSGDTGTGLQVSIEQ